VKHAKEQESKVKDLELANADLEAELDDMHDELAEHRPKNTTTDDGDESTHASLTPRDTPSKVADSRKAEVAAIAAAAEADRAAQEAAEAAAEAAQEAEELREYVGELEEMVDELEKESKEAKVAQQDGERRLLQLEGMFRERGGRGGGRAVAFEVVENGGGGDMTRRSRLAAAEEDIASPPLSPWKSSKPGAELPTITMVGDSIEDMAPLSPNWNDGMPTLSLPADSEDEGESEAGGGASRHRVAEEPSPTPLSNAVDSAVQAANVASAVAVAVGVAKAEAAAAAEQRRLEARDVMDAAMDEARERFEVLLEEQRDEWRERRAAVEEERDDLRTRLKAAEAELDEIAQMDEEEEEAAAAAEAAAASADEATKAALATAEAKVSRALEDAAAAREAERLASSELRDVYADLAGAKTRVEHERAALSDCEAALSGARAEVAALRDEVAALKAEAAEARSKAERAAVSQRASAGTEAKVPVEATASPAPCASPARVPSPPQGSPSSRSTSSLHVQRVSVASTSADAVVTSASFATATATKATKATKAKRRSRGERLARSGDGPDAALPPVMKVRPANRRSGSCPPELPERSSPGPPKHPPPTNPTPMPMEPSVDLALEISGGALRPPPSFSSPKVSAPELTLSSATPSPVTSGADDSSYSSVSSYSPVPVPVPVTVKAAARPSSGRRSGGSGANGAVRRSGGMVRRKSRSIEPMDMVATQPQPQPGAQPAACGNDRQDSRDLRDDSREVVELGEMQPHLDVDDKTPLHAPQNAGGTSRRQGEDEGWRRERRNVGSWGLGYEPANTEPRTGQLDDRADFGTGAGDGGPARVVVVGKAPSRGPKPPAYGNIGAGFGLREHRPQDEAGSGGARTIMVRRSGGSRA